MFGWLRCRVGRRVGLHGDVVAGIGGVGDSAICLRCGLEDDQESPVWLGCDTYREVDAPGDWPAIEAARALPRYLGRMQT